MSNEHNHYLSSQFTEADKHASEHGIMLRRYNLGGLITADYKANRLNVRTDENDVIVEIVGFG